MKIAVVLGNRMRDDGGISDLMRIRLEMALQLYEELRPDRIIVSGGAPNKKAGVREADVMYDYLVERGMEPAVIIKEGESNITNQNARNSCKIARELGADTLIVCSSREHLERGFANPIKQFRRHLKGTDIVVEAYTKHPGE